MSIPLPPFPSPQNEMEEFLLSPQNLSIHNFRSSQKWVHLSSNTTQYISMQ